MHLYLISGPSGSGKTTVGNELRSRGFHVIETDHEPGLSSWVNNDTGKKPTELPDQPYHKEWVDSHSWLWDGNVLKNLVHSAQEEHLFFCGGAFNEKDFYGLFDKRFGLYVDDDILMDRLLVREPERWVVGSAERAKKLAWNQKFRDYSREMGAILLDSSVPTTALADTVVALAIDKDI